LKVKSVEEELEVKLLDMRKSYESRISDAEEYCARQSLSLETAEKEVKALRDDIRNLQVNLSDTLLLFFTLQKSLYDL